MKELGEALRVIFEKLSVFFDLFDLSFFVSGTVALGAEGFWFSMAHYELPAGLEGWTRVLAIVIAIYVNGLVCFAVGRSLRVKVYSGKKERFDERLKKSLQDHGLSDHLEMVSFLNKVKDEKDSEYSDRLWRLYIRLWVEIRESEKVRLSYAFLNRYWVMSATYDGLAFAFLIWFICIFACGIGWGVSQSFHWLLWVPAILIDLLIVWACLREGDRYLKNQIAELVATIVIKKGFNI